MIRKLIVLSISLFFCGLTAMSQSAKSDLHMRAESTDAQKHIATARSLYIHAFNDYANKGQVSQGVECAVKATGLYYKENFWKEAFDLLRRADQTIVASKLSDKNKAALFYQVTKERMNMYMRLRKSESVRDQLSNMEILATRAADESLKNDMLYNKAIYYYTFGMNAKGNEVFKEMATKLTGQKEYDKVDEVYQTLIANGRRSNNASMVAQSYSSYIAWKDSTTKLKHADETGALKKQIASNEASIAEKDSSLSTRQAIIVGLSVLAAILAAVLVIGAIVLMRYMVLTNKQKKNIRLLTESNALKAQFIGNISGQLEPTLKKLNSNSPEVKALLSFSSNIQLLSELENTLGDGVELEDTALTSFCENLMEQIRTKVKKGVALTVKAPNMRANINKEYVSHILLHLLNNAAEHTPEDGTITLEFKKRGPHSFQFMVSDTGEGIAEDKREDVFKPFREVHDLTKGDGLGLPICKQMALKMNGDIDIDANYSKGTRFVLDLKA